MPHERNALWLANVEVMSRLLCASVPDTLLELLGEANDLGGKPGLIATRPPWSQALVLHPHGHGLVTGRGTACRRPVGGRAARLSAADAGGHGALPGQTAGRHAPGLAARAADTARG
jgi:hypothetical protein